MGTQYMEDCRSWGCSTWKTAGHRHAVCGRLQVMGLQYMYMEDHRLWACSTWKTAGCWHGTQFQSSTEVEASMWSSLGKSLSSTHISTAGECGLCWCECWRVTCLGKMSPCLHHPFIAVDIFVRRLCYCPKIQCHDWNFWIGSGFNRVNVFGTQMHSGALCCTSVYLPCPLHCPRVMYDGNAEYPVQRCLGGVFPA